MRSDDEVTATGAAGLWEAGEEVEDWEFPPSTKPLPLNGIMFRMSCNPEPGRSKYTNSKFTKWVKFREKKGDEE